MTKDTRSAILAWHFVGNRLRDGRLVPPDGVTLEHDGPLALCQTGLHASRRLIDALQYAPGNTICRVRLSGQRLNARDKMVAARRTILWRIDAADMLAKFARLCALDVIHLWTPPPTLREWLETSNPRLRARVQAVAERRAMNAAAGEVDAWDASRAAKYAAWAAAARRVPI
ncbi:MAG: hypothetical protein FJY55_13230 [Betaproteobacteria bacterium]|nr:hypothetical protein [Betaproteobacteria bacterium]